MTKKEKTVIGVVMFLLVLIQIPGLYFYGLTKGWFVYTCFGITITYLFHHILDCIYGSRMERRYHELQEALKKDIADIEERLPFIKITLEDEKQMKSSKFH